MNITIESTKELNYFETENLTREVFWDVFKPGCEEHLVLSQLRKSEAYLPALDLVAKVDEKIVGHVISTKAIVLDANGNSHTVLCVGPVSAANDLQRMGIGSALMNESIKIAKDLGFKAMILFGHTEYYPKFGFKNAEIYKITTKDGLNFDPFMALELSEGSLNGITGKFYEDIAFSTNETDLIEFEKKFPYKEKRKVE